MGWRGQVVLGLALLGATHSTTGGRAVAGSDQIGQPDSLTQSRQRYVAAVRAALDGRGAAPAESVFRNIEILRGVRAELIPVIMDQGFSRSLGVGCTHCHVADDWARGDSAAYGIARDMFRMTRRINTELLSAIPGLRGTKPEVTCSTCHRGVVTPATRVPG